VWAVLACASLAWLLSAPIANFLIVRSHPHPAQAVVVLSGSSVYAERIRHASELYFQNRAPTILLTNDGVRRGWSRRLQTNPRSIERGKDGLIAAGVPADRIVMLPGRVTSTYDEALAVRAYARNAELRSVLIVTSAYHSRRALWVFTRVLAGEGVSVGVDPAPPGFLSPAPDAWWLTRRGWWAVAAEYPKLAYYLVTYR